MFQGTECVFLQKKVGLACNQCPDSGEILVPPRPHPARAQINLFAALKDTHSLALSPCSGPGGPHLLSHLILTNAFKLSENLPVIAKDARSGEVGPSGQSHPLGSKAGI